MHVGVACMLECDVIQYTCTCAHASHSNPQKFSLRNLLFHTFVKIFSLESFPLYGTLLMLSTVRTVCYMVHSHFQCDNYLSVGIMCSLIQGVLQRVKTLPLHSFSFEVESGGCNTGDFRRLCDAIFSLPEIDQLHICLGRGFIDMNYVNVIRKSWIRPAEGIRMKALLIKAPRSSGIDTDVLSQFTQRYRFVEYY